MPSSSVTFDPITAAYTGRGLVLTNLIVPRPLGTAADGLKFSCAEGVIIRGECRVPGGTENACDVNNGSSVAVFGTLALWGGGQAGLVVKGGSRFRTEIDGSVILIPVASSKTDVLVDDWSDQSSRPSFVSGTFRRPDGQPVRVVWGRWHRPKISGPSVVNWRWVIALHFYNPLKGFVRWVLRIPRGTKGPAWL